MPIYLGRDKISGGGGVSIEEITPEAIGALPETTTPADIGAEKERLQFENKAVSTSAFVADTTYTDFGFRASVALSGVTANMTPEVVFNTVDAMSGIYAPITACYDGGIYLYANAVPEADITIPTIICWKVVG